MTAWLNMIGQITITAGINIAAAIYLVGAVTRIFGLPADQPVPVFGDDDELVLLRLRDGPDHDPAGADQHLRHPPDRAAERLQRLLAHRRRADHRPAAHGVRHPPQQPRLPVLPGHRGQPARRLLGRPRRPGRPRRRSSSADFKFASPLFALFPGLADLYRAAPFALVFVLALLQAQWTYTGYDASAHVAEETVMARLNSRLGRVPVGGGLGGGRLRRCC